ncbi:hypothetical protein [Burkholderia stagnalis]|uniref:hypothetical protein n=1 Tax=Burkholderia stagnalis TaxID=1503054 RepID=UPI001E34BD1C|nr:hypothetical protein [Burkholderia stagnalis]
MSLGVEMDERREPKWRRGGGRQEQSDDLHCLPDHGRWSENNIDSRAKLLDKPLSSVGKADEVECRSLIGWMTALYRFSPAILALYAAGALIAWFAPEDALVRWPFLNVVVINVGKIFPLLHNAVEKSKFHDVTALYFALMLAAFPFRLIVGCRLFYAGQAKAKEVYGKLSLRERLKVIFMVPILFFCSVFLLIEGYYYELNFIAISGSRLWLSLVGPLFAGGAQIICISLSFGWIRFYLSNWKKEG